MTRQFSEGLRISMELRISILQKKSSSLLGVTEEAEQYAQMSRHIHSVRLPHLGRRAPPNPR